MIISVPNFANPLLNLIAQGDMSIFEKNYDFTLTEWAGYKNWNVLSVAAAKGHLNLVNRLLEIEAVRAYAAEMDSWALRQAAENRHSEVVHALAKIKWPLGKQDMPEGMQQYLPIIMAGAQLYTAKREQERILMSAL